MILDNTGLDYAQMLLFVFGFLVCWKIVPNSRASGNTCFNSWLQKDHVNIAKTNVTSEKTVFEVLFQ